MTDFELLHKFLNHSSTACGVLSDKQHQHAMSLCDGFGRMTITQLRELGLTWDWSHVRDSSDAAIVSAAAFVREQLAFIDNTDGELEDVIFFCIVTCHPDDQWRVCNFTGVAKHVAVEAPSQELAVKKVEDAGLTIQRTCSIFEVDPRDPRVDQIINW